MNGDISEDDIVAMLLGLGSRAGHEVSGSGRWAPQEHPLFTHVDVAAGGRRGQGSPEVFVYHLRHNKQAGGLLDTSREWAGCEDWVAGGKGLG